jgi:hypothetical protein
LRRPIRYQCCSAIEEEEEEKGGGGEEEGEEEGEEGGGGGEEEEDDDDDDDFVLTPQIKGTSKEVLYFRHSCSNTHADYSKFFYINRQTN